MSRPFDVRLPLEQAYLREAMLAVELLDPVTLERVSHGVKVTAVGLTSTPIVNFGGLFVWLKQPTTNFQKLIIEPGSIVVHLGWGEVERKVQRIEQILEKNKNPGLDIDLRFVELAVLKSRVSKDREVNNGI